MSDRDLTTSRRQVFGYVEKGSECRICGRDVDDGRMVYCSDYCKFIANGVMALLNWSSVRRRIIDRDDATCQQCGFKQEWLDRGYAHLRAIAQQELGDRPEGISALRLGSGDVTENERRDNRKAWEDYRQRKKELIERYFGVSSDFVSWPTPENRLEVDHVTPVTDGGHPFDPANLRTLCESCHADKTAQENSERADQRRYDRPDVERTLADFIADGGFTSVADKRNGGVDGE